MKNDHIEFNQRKIGKNYRSLTGHFPSIKNDKSIAFESKLENSFFLTLEFDDSVFSYQEQPQIEIFLNGKKKVYSADCYIKKVANSAERDLLVEVKYTSELEKNKEEFRNKFEAIRIAADEMNLDFMIFTEQNFTEIELYNLDFLYRYKTHPQNNKYEEMIMNKMKSIKRIKAKDLLININSSVVENAIISNTIWSLVAKEKLSADIESKVFSMDSYVEVL